MNAKYDINWYNLRQSILILLLPKLPEVDGSVAERAVLQLMFFHFVVVHLVLAGLAPVVVAVRYWFSWDNTGREVASAGSAYGVIFRNKIFTGAARALDLLPGGLLGRVFREDADSDISISLSFFRISHTFKFHKSSWALFVTLGYDSFTLL